MSQSTPRLSGFQKEQIRGSLSAGCDRAAAAKGASATLGELNNELTLDAEFAATVRKAEGGAVFHRMKALHDAAKDPKQWRAAAWWLEQRTKRQIARLKGQQVTAQHWTYYGKLIIDAVMATVTMDADRQALVERLETIFDMKAITTTSEENQPDEQPPNAPDS